jgi:hypothetical protein
MKLYHASTQELSSLKPQQATRGSVDVPVSELQNGVYLTPHYDFALAMGSRPENSSTQLDEITRKITFEKPELFDPNKEVFIYVVETDSLPKENIEYIDENQYIIKGLAEVIPNEVQKVKAEEVLKYYELTNCHSSIHGKISNCFSCIFYTISRSTFGSNFFYNCKNNVFCTNPFS